MATRYRVVEDLQGGEFGMGRDYTAEEWLEQAVDWRDSDDSWGDYGEGVDCYGDKHLDSRSWFIKFWKRMIKDGKEQELIDYIADIWALRFEKVESKMIINCSDKYDMLTAKYSTSAREYFEILRLAILHVDGVWEDTSYKITTYEKSDEVYKCAIKILNTLYKENNK